MFSLKIDQEIELALLNKGHAKQIVTVVDENIDYLRLWWSSADKFRQEDFLEKYIASESKSFINKQGFSLGIFYQKALVGVIGVFGVDAVYRNATIGYWLAESCKDKDVAKRVLAAIADYCFAEFDVNRVDTFMADKDIERKETAESLGFVLEGTLRNRIKIDGHFFDALAYSQLKSEHVAHT